MTAKQHHSQDDAIIQDAISPVRLHGEACIECGTAEGPLAPAGYRYTRELGWAVVACTEHAREGS